MPTAEAEYAATAYCPNCNSVSQFTAHQKRAYITLLFIPLIPLGRGPVRLMCTRCGFQTVPAALEQVQGRHNEQLALALQASAVYLFRRLPNPDTALLSWTGNLLSDCYGISSEP